MLIHEGFQQAVPELGSSSWSDDEALQAVIRRLVPSDVFHRIDVDLKRFEECIAGRMLQSGSAVGASGEFDRLLRQQSATCV